MKIPNYDQIKNLHDSSIEVFGGERGIMNPDGLKSFIDSVPNAVYLGKKNIVETAAYIYVRIIQNHYFVDGNKRAGLGTLLTYLDVNNCAFTERIEFYDLTLRVAQELKDPLHWVEKLFKEKIKCFEK